MRKRVVSKLICIAVLTTGLLTVECNAAIWIKGQIHCHTTNSDGNTSPNGVASWYKAHGYGFVFITDHNRFTDPVPIDVDPSDGFIVIGGEEISSQYNGIPIHMNALGISQTLPALSGNDSVDTLQRNLDVINAKSSLSQVNHPNWYYAFNSADLLKIYGCDLIEIWNASSGCNNEGDRIHPSVEKNWDDLLTAGMTIYATATDDAHNYTSFGSQYDNPGRTWLGVHIDSLSEKNIMAALKCGDFYASTGVELIDISITDKEISLTIKQGPRNVYTTQFIGKGGKVLAQVKGLSPRYVFTKSPDEEYVRAKVVASDGSFAWTQPVRYRNIGDTLNLPLESTVNIPKAVVTSGSGDVPGRLYIEQEDRSCGMCINYMHGTALENFNEGDVVSVKGTLRRYGGELCIQQTTVNKLATQSKLAPVGMSNKWMGGSGVAAKLGVTNGKGANNLSLLVSVWGKVTVLGEDYFYIDDGSKCLDNSGIIGLKIITEGKALPSDLAKGCFVAVTGISSCEIVNSITKPLIRIRKSSDVSVLRR